MRLELAVLAAACLALLWLNRGEREPEPLQGWLIGPRGSLALAMGVAWLAPGWALCRLLVRAWPGWVAAAALSVGLGMAWLCLPAAVLLSTGGRLETLAGVVTALDTALVLAYMVLRLRRRRAPVPERCPPLPAPSPWLAAAAALALARLIALSARWPRFSFASDEWILMRTIRYYLEAAPIASSADFDVWDLVIALLVRLARVDLVDAYRVYLPPMLIVAASLAFLALAETLFRDRNAACVSYVLLALYALSDMQTRGDGAGMGLVVRIAEDKYTALVVAVPLAQAAFLAFLRAGQPALLAAAAVIGVAAVLVYPLSLVWLGLSAGATAVAAIASGRIRLRRGLAVALVTVSAAGAAVAWWLRSLRADAYFRLYDPDWPFADVLRTFSRRQLLIFSGEDGFYMAHPVLLRHPLLIAGVLAALALVPRFRASLRVQFLVCSTFLPLLLVYNPLTARWLGGWITPWMLHRVLWMLPVALVLGYTLHSALLSWQRRLAAGRGGETLPARGRYALLWIALLAAATAALAARRADSWAALKARNRVAISSGERELMHAIGRDPLLAGRVLAPWGIGIRLPTWTSRLQPYPGLDEMRWNDPARLSDWRAFYESDTVGAAEVALLRNRGVDYVITRSGTRIDAALRRRPGPFRPIYGGPSYSLYAWRPQRWVDRP